MSIDSRCKMLLTYVDWLRCKMLLIFILVKIQKELKIKYFKHIFFKKLLSRFCFHVLLSLSKWFLKLLITPVGIIFTKNSLKFHCFSLKSVVPQTQRCDIEEALIPLFEEINADSVKFVNYEREIHKKLTRKLSLRKNVLRTQWLKKLVRGIWSSS